MKKTLLAAFIVSVLVSHASAQSNDFNYQGSLRNGGSPANGNYDFEFALFDALAGGNQVGSTVTANGVLVANGVFSVALNFGAAFPGANRFIEVRVRQSGGGALTTLVPRQPVLSTPYAIMSANANQANNALQLGGIAAGNYVLNTDTRLSDARSPLAGSGNYIQNTSSQQTTSNFNISGNGIVGGTVSANVVNSAIQFNLNGGRILSSPSIANLFVGLIAGGTANTGAANTFVGTSAGAVNTSGAGNVFLGTDAGLNNTTGGSNVFIGRSAGLNNISGGSNTFVGNTSGDANTGGNFNAFFGIDSGGANTTGSNNTFVGGSSGNTNTTGGSNTFIGRNTGQTNVLGANNTMLGVGANVGSDGLNFATAIGAGAVVGTSNTVVLGRSTDTVVAPNLVQVGTLGAAGTTQLCRNASNQIATCSAPLQDQTNEAQAKQIKEQNEIITRQQEELQRQRKELDALKALVCSQNQTAEICQPKQ